MGSVGSPAVDIGVPSVTINSSLYFTPPVNKEYSLTPLFEVYDIYYQFEIPLLEGHNNAKFHCQYSI